MLRSSLPSLRPGSRRPGTPRGLGLCVLLALALVPTVAGCARSEVERTTALDRETFIATWVDLREAALRSPTGDLGPAERERILARHEVTPEAMEEFVRIRGDDADYMLGVWEEIEQTMRVNAGELQLDSVGGA